MNMVQFGNGNCYMGMGIKNIFSHTSNSRLSNKYNAHTMGIPWIWEWTWCNLGSGMGTGIAIWEWVGNGIRNSFPQTSASRPLLSEMKKRSVERGTQRIWLLHAVEHSLALGELAVAELRTSGRPAVVLGVQRVRRSQYGIISRAEMWMECERRRLINAISSLLFDPKIHVLIMRLPDHSIKANTTYRLYMYMLQVGLPVLW